MKAVICTKYGLPEVLELREIEKPTPKDNEILIRNYTTSVSSGDCRIRSFTVPPLFWIAGRLGLGITKPRKAILGRVFAGVIEEIGKNVNRFKKGDQVFGPTGHNFGSYAEYICLPEKSDMIIKPEKISYEEASAIPFGGITALQFLRKGNIKREQEVLINGASGAVGTYAVQLAKYYGANVTGVCSGTNLEMIKSLGADKVIDYTKEDFTKNGHKYDIIFDAVGKTKFSDCKDSIKEKGYYLHSVMMMPKINKLWHLLTSGKIVIGGGVKHNTDDLEFLCELVKEEKIKPVIDKIYPIEQIVEAHRYVDKGHKKGVVIIKI